MPNKFQQKICVARYKDNCFILVSATKRNEDETYGEYRVKANISFLYDSGNVAVEWEPEHGPIQVWNKCSEGDEKAREHYYYDFVEDRPFNWTQLSVDANGLPQAFDNGDYDYIFNVLKRWAERRY